MENTKISLLRMLFGMMINPGLTLKNSLVSSKWYLSVAVSAVAFGLFFGQTGFDLYRTGQKEFEFVLLTSAIGLAYGLIVIPITGVFIWAVLKLSKGKRKIKETVSAFCLSYSGALIYGLIGLVFSLALGWKTSVAFGVTGVLWAIGPMIISIKDLTGGRNRLSIPIATIVGIAVLASWSALGNI